MQLTYIHDWLVTPRGGEKVLESLQEIFPAPIHTLIAKEKLFSEQEIITSFLQSFPWIEQWYRLCLPLFPAAVEQWDLSDYKIVLSISHSVAKGVITSPDQVHICYCLTPMRHIWDHYHSSLQSVGFLKRAMLRYFAPRLRNWDVTSSHRVDHFVAISHHVRKRIEKYYRRSADVIYPPVNTHRFNRSEKRDDYYITVSWLVPYKRVDLLIKAFEQMSDQRLVIIGDGPLMCDLKKIAPPNVELVGFVDEETLSDYVSKARAFLYAAEEDFGITPVEAQAAGIPVIAFGKGGVRETIIEGKTGLFFYQQTVKEIVSAVKAFEKQDDFDPNVIEKHAEQFSKERFQQQFLTYIRDIDESDHSGRRKGDAALAPL